MSSLVCIAFFFLLHLFVVFAVPSTVVIDLLSLKVNQMSQSVIERDLFCIKAALKMLHNGQKDLDGQLNATTLQKQQKQFWKAKSQTKYDQLKSVSVKMKDRRLLKNAFVIPPMENKIWEEILVHFMQKSSAGQIKFQTQRATSASQVIKDSCWFLVVFHIWLLLQLFIFQAILEESRNSSACWSRGAFQRCQSTRKFCPRIGFWMQTGCWRRQRTQRQRFIDNLWSWQRRKCRHQVIRIESRRGQRTPNDNSPIERSIQTEWPISSVVGCSSTSDIHIHCSRSRCLRMKRIHHMNRSWHPCWHANRSCCVGLLWRSVKGR